MTDVPGQDGERAAPRRVVRSRKGLWLAACLALVAFMPFVLVFTRTGGGDAEPLVLTESDQESIRDGLRMISPSFSGRTEDGDPYTVRADWALPNGPKPTRITLSRLTATLSLEAGQEAVMTSKRGIFFPLRERLRLEDGVFARTSDGYTLETEAALIDVKEKTLQTDGEVIGIGPRGSIRADTLEALDGAERMIIFTGNVRVVIVPESDLSKPADQQPE